MCPTWEPGDEPLVGVVDTDPTGDGPSIDTDALEAVCDDHGTSVVTGGLESVLAAAPSLLVVRGDATLSAVARTRPDVPVLPVGAVTGIEAVAPDRLRVALAATLEGDATRRRHDLLGIDVDTSDAETDASEAFEPPRALFDVTLVTDEPARISEYSVASRGELVASCRADGVVVATPAGSHGYASTVDAPRLSRAVDAVAVAPIAPFVRQTRQWVVPTDGLVLTVERDDGDIALVVDDRPVGTLPVGTRVTVAATASLSTLVVPNVPREQ